MTGAVHQAIDVDPRRDGGALLALHVALSILVGLAATVVWHATGRGSAWPMWVWFGLAVPAVLHGAIRYALRVGAGRTRTFAAHGAVTAVLAATLTVLWPLTDSHAFWPIWPLLGLGALLTVHGIVAAFWPRIVPPSEQALTERVDELTRTRRGALDVQAAELRRIERDLHDGAQARLVTLSLQLGRAEARLEDRPEEAAIVRAAREEAGAAIAELRDLARGISPPMLADRGLTAACEGLARRSPARARVESTLDGRLAPVVETAAYFVVSEALTNVAKHAPAASARVRLERRGDVLVVTVADDGPGGADPEGSGLVGLRRRVEALDGRLAIDAPPGGGTEIPGGAAVRVVIAEDHALLREGIIALLRERGMEVVAQAEDGPGLLRIVAGHKPDLAIVDVRLPPTYTDEGVRAAIAARERLPGLGVLILSQYVEPVYTAELLADGRGGIGYLLKERVGDVRGFLDAIERVAAGGTALDREVVAALVSERQSTSGDALSRLTPRERETLALMAEGRTNAAIARQMVVTPGAVEKHVSSIFAKLGLPATDDDHRRILAVLTYLRAGGGADT